MEQDGLVGRRAILRAAFVVPHQFLGEGTPVHHFVELAEEVVLRDDSVVDQVAKERAFARFPKALRCHRYLLAGFSKVTTPERFKRSSHGIVIKHSPHVRIDMAEGSQYTVENFRLRRR